MCGINGFAGRPSEAARPVFETFFRHVMVGTQERGPHATGIAGYQGANRSVIGKGPVTAEQFVKTPVWKKGLQTRSLIGHCRWATHGSPARNENNHPFESGKWAMVHNGVIMGHGEIAAREGVKLSSECDSEVILRVFARGAKKGGGGDAKAGLQQFVNAVKNFRADYAVAILDRTNGKIRLLRDEARPCAILRLPALNAVFFASTTEILKRAMDRTLAEHQGFPLLDGADGWECVPGRVYVLSPNSLEVEHEPVSVPPDLGAAISAAARSRHATGVNPKGELVYVCDTCGEVKCRCEELTAPVDQD